MRVSSPVIDLGNIKIYHFQEKRATLLRASSWYLKQSKQHKVILKSIESTVEVHIQDEAVIISYDSTKAYFCKLQNGYASIHFPTNDQNIQLFQYKLQQANLKLIDWEKAKEELKKQIQNNCGSNIDKQTNTNPSSIQKVGFQIGKLFGSIDHMMRGSPVQEKTQQLKEKVDVIKEEKLSEETKSTWKGLKAKMVSINEAISQKIKPASQKISETTSKLGDKFNQSDNSVVKGIRNFGLKLKNSLNQGYKNKAETNKNEGKKANEEQIQSQRGLK